MADSHNPKDLNEEFLTPRIGTIIRQWRKLRNESLQDVAERAGISPIHLSRIERLESSPTEEVIRKLAVAFDVPISALFGERKLTRDEQEAAGSEEQRKLLTEIRSLLLPIRHAVVHDRPISSWKSGRPDIKASGTNITPGRPGSLIRLVGVGKFGGNLINKLVAGNYSGIDFIAVDTDISGLRGNLAQTKIHLRQRNMTSTISDQARVKQATLKNKGEIQPYLEGAELVFIVAGMGEDTGTGGAPTLARIAKELGALTIGVVTMPFLFEGKKRMQQAKEGLHELRTNIDTLISIAQERVLAIIDADENLLSAVEKVDRVAVDIIRAISDLITVHGLITLDFADVRTILGNGGMGIASSGTASGENRASKAAMEAITSPLRKAPPFKGAKGLLINITGGPSLTLHEVNEVATSIQEEADKEANIIFGAVVDDTIEDELHVTVIATGFDEDVESPQQRNTRKLAHYGLVDDDIIGGSYRESTHLTEKKERQVPKVSSAVPSSPPGPETGCSG